MASIICENRQLIAETGGSDEQIKALRHLSQRPQPPTMLAEDFAGLCIDPQHGHTQEKVHKGLLIARRVGGKVYALIQFREGDDRHRASLIAHGIHPAHDCAVAIQVMDDPIRVDEIAEGHRVGTGRVETKRSA